MEKRSTFLNLGAQRVWHKNYAHRTDATTDIADYFVGTHNSIRFHLGLGNLSPNAFKYELTSKDLANRWKLLDRYSVLTVGSTPSPE
jgi:hypothetical protein